MSMCTGVCKNIIAPHCGCRHKYRAAVKLYAIILQEQTVRARLFENFFNVCLMFSSLRAVFNYQTEIRKKFFLKSNDLLFFFFAGGSTIFQTYARNLRILSTRLRSGFPILFLQSVTVNGRISYNVLTINLLLVGTRYLSKRIQ